MRLIFERSKIGKKGVSLPPRGVPEKGALPDEYKRKTSLGLPDVSEPEVIRHFTNLAKKNLDVDNNFYPLGSCTMKYNPKFTEKIASDNGFASLHPLAPQLKKGGMLTQGAMEVIYDMENLLCRITGMDCFTMQPMAGAHGELTGVMLIAAYHKAKKNEKKYILIPDSGHGTNPASAAIAGYEVLSVPSNDKGVMDMEAFGKLLSEEVAAVMLTCPNTLGVFNRRIKEITEMAHKVDALMYYDGANLNAILGKVRPGEMGFDIVHLNLHKTFATPHGGGGPGAGPVGVKKQLEKFMPVSRVIKRKDGTFALDYDHPNSIGYISPFYGNFAVILKAYAYILLLGADGLKDVAENAVLNSNYLIKKLRSHYEIPYEKDCLHEFVLSADKQKKLGVSALDLAKALIDSGIHPPTVYFPLIVKEAMMIEPTETESKETLDHFVKNMLDLASMAEKDPEVFKTFPVKAPVGRMDEIRAARELDVASLGESCEDH